MRHTENRWRSLWLIVWLGWIGATPVLAQTGTLEVHPPLAVLGRFAAGHSGEDHLNPGTTVVRIQTTDAWDLMVTLLQPFRRLSDNLELPSERAWQLFPDIPQAFSNYLPVRLDYGAAALDEAELIYDWQLFQWRLQQYLQETDPPGVYQSQLQFELRTRSGDLLGETMTVTLEFEIQPRVEIEIVEDIQPLVVERAGETASGSPLFVIVRSNAAWELTAHCTGNLDGMDGEDPIPMRGLSWQLEQGGEWESFVTDPEPVSGTSRRLARGDAPLPFTMGEFILPLMLTVETVRTTVPSDYTTDIEFLVRVDFAAH